MSVDLVVGLRLVDNLRAVSRFTWDPWEFVRRLVRGLVLTWRPSSFWYTYYIGEEIESPWFRAAPFP